jgi:hypothetical protein
MHISLREFVMDYECMLSLTEDIFNSVNYVARLYSPDSPTCTLSRLAKVERLGKECHIKENVIQSKLRKDFLFAFRRTFPTGTIYINGSPHNKSLFFQDLLTHDSSDPPIK